MRSGGPIAGIGGYNSAAECAASSAVLLAVRCSVQASDRQRVADTTIGSIPVVGPLSLVRPASPSRRSLALGGPIRPASLPPCSWRSPRRVHRICYGIRTDPTATSLSLMSRTVRWCCGPRGHVRAMAVAGQVRTTTWSAQGRARSLSKDSATMSSSRVPPTCPRGVGRRAPGDLVAARRWEAAMASIR